MKYKFSEIQLKGNKQVNNAKALLDLLNEYEKTKFTMSFTRARTGRAKLSKGKFTIPEHAIKSSETYLLYYVIHEYTHCLTNCGHNEEFKNKESELLKLFGIDIEYAKAYPKTLYANGKKEYEAKTRKSISYTIYGDGRTPTKRYHYTKL